MMMMIILERISWLTLSFIASFGLGALVGPFVASAVLSRWAWNTTYMILCGLAAINALTTLVTFRHVRIADERHLDLHHPDLERTAVDMHDSDGASTTSSHTFVEDKNILWSSIRQRVAHVGAVYLLFYVGIEVTLGNWAYTFLINERSSDNDSMSHIMSGYWAGLCLGRIVLGYITLRFGEKRMVYIYISILISMLVVFWLVPNVPINATALVISGIALGPLFPTLLSIARQCVPCRLYAATVGFLSAVGDNKDGCWHGKSFSDTIGSSSLVVLDPLFFHSSLVCLSPMQVLQPYHRSQWPWHVPSWWDGYLFPTQISHPKFKYTNIGK